MSLEEKRHKIKIAISMLSGIHWLQNHKWCWTSEMHVFILLQDRLFCFSTMPPQCSLGYASGVLMAAGAADVVHHRARRLDGASRSATRPPSASSLRRLTVPFSNSRWPGVPGLKSSFCSTASTMPRRATYTLDSGFLIWLLLSPAPRWASALPTAAGPTP